MNQKIEIYTKPTCPYCIGAKYLLGKMGLNYHEIDISVDPTKRAEMIDRSQGFTVPQIFIDDESIGGYDNLVELIDNGVLNTLLEGPQKHETNPKDIQHEELYHVAA